MLRSMLLLCCCLLGACASVVPPPDARTLLHDEAFQPLATPIDPTRVFALSPAMQELLAQTGRLRGDDPRSELLNLLFKKRRQVLEYDATSTRTAAQAFEAGRGNCLSLAIMTAAFAKAVKLTVDYREVPVEESWSRSGDLLFASGHVNLALTNLNTSERTDLRYESVLIVDFIPPTQAGKIRSHSIGESTVLAMFMNNRAAETLAAGDVNEAYWWAREALRQDPGLLIAYNTLAVVYARSGHPQWAVPLLEAMLVRDPNNTKVMSNLVTALRAVGRDGEAHDWAAQLAARQPYPPFHFYDAGQVAMHEGDWASARVLFSRELERQPYNADIHFWLAQANFRLGDAVAARRHLELAQRNSTTQQETALYAAKLDWLRAHGAPQ